MRDFRISPGDHYDRRPEVESMYQAEVQQPITKHKSKVCYDAIVVSWSYLQDQGHINENNNINNNRQCVNNGWTSD